MSTRRDKPHLSLLLLPAELRNQIWTLCLKLPDNTLVCITEQASFSCNNYKEITPALLRVNQQMHEEVKAVLHSQNTFGIRLNEESCMRQIKEEKPKQNTFAIPSLWNSAFRKNVYQIYRLHVMVAHSREELDEGLSRGKANYQLQRLKAEPSDIVKNAVEEL
ncbi:hypothetical protein MMC29_000083 [Sticta canariensis]|nr:hypothetical protein [Sticta canariensis]